MFYVLSKEEFENLVPREEYDHLKAVLDAKCQRLDDFDEAIEMLNPGARQEFRGLLATVVHKNIRA